MDAHPRTRMRWKLRSRRTLSKYEGLRGDMVHTELAQFLRSTPEKRNRTKFSRITPSNIFEEIECFRWYNN